jgi:hypothetical protein
MSKELERIFKELLRLKEDLQSSNIEQVSPYINYKVWVQFPKEHLLRHLNNLEQYIALYLTPTPLEQLREEIISELNELYFEEYEIEEGSYEYLENSDYCLFMYDMTLPEFKYNKVDKEIYFEEYTNLKLASKIIKYFELKEVK